MLCPVAAVAESLVAVVVSGKLAQERLLSGVRPDHRMMKMLMKRMIKMLMLKMLINSFSPVCDLIIVNMRVIV